MSERIKLGDLAKDEVTGFEGIVTCRSEWLAGCVRCSLQPQETYTAKDGDLKPAETGCFDEGNLVLVKAGAVQPRFIVTPTDQPDDEARPGGDQVPPLRAVDAVR